MDSFEKLNINLKGRNSGKIKTTCPECSHTRKKKSDPCLQVDIDNGIYKCYNPGCTFKGNVNMQKTEKKEVAPKDWIVPKFSNKTDLKDGTVKWFKGRGITQKTLTHFKITESEEWMPNMPEDKKKVNTIQFNYFFDGKMINAKYRDGFKNFRMVKGARKTFYNIDAIKDSEECLISEGEMDAMSWWEAGYDFALSVPNGAVKGTNNLDYLGDVWDSHFANKKKIYIAVDCDEAGNELRDSLLSRFGKDICYVVKYDSLNTDEATFKDANDVLKYRGKEKLMNLLETAEGFDIEGLIRADSIKDEMLEQFRYPEAKKRGTTTYMGEDFDSKFTWKRGELTVLYGPGNQGKSCFGQNMWTLKSINEGDKWGIFSPEQYPPIDFFDDIIHTMYGKSTDPNFKRYQMTEQQYLSGIEFVNDHFFYVYPEDDHSPDMIMEKFRQVVGKHGITGIIIDPLNQLDKDLSTRDDKFISKFYSVLKRFILTHDLYCMVVTHGDARFNLETREMLKPSMYKDIESGKMTSKKADNILFYMRPNFEINISDTYCIVGSQKIKKQKLVGKPGDSEFHFEGLTNRYYGISGVSGFGDTHSRQFQREDIPENFVPVAQINDNVDEPPPF